MAAFRPAHAQPGAASNASPTDVIKVPVAGEHYEDRLMDGVPSQDDSDAASAQFNPQGWPRGISLQLTRNLQTSQNPSITAGNSRTDTQGIQLDAYIETPNFGTLSAHALALGGRNTSGLTSWSLRQTGMPFDGGWRADNAIGTTNLLLPELARRNNRLALPTPQVLGASTMWRNEGNGSLALAASSGEPGRFEGFPQSRLVGLGGQVSSLFVQASAGGQTLAIAAAQGRDILPEVAPIPGEVAARVSPRGYYVSIAQDERVSGASWQASAVSSNSSGIDSTGLWVDAIWRDGGHRHEASVFRFAQDLTWIDRPLANDLTGGSYRYDYHSLRWDLSANIESFASLSGHSPSGWYANASGRRLLTAGTSAGGGFAFRTFGVTSRSGFGYFQWQNRLGISRLQLDASSTEGGQRSQAVTFDHSLYAENGMSLSISLSLERLQSVSSTIATPRMRENAATVGINGRLPLTSTLSLQGSLRARNVSGAGADRGTTLAANIALDWQISQTWSLGASFYENRGVLTDTIAVQSPLIVPEIVRLRPSDRGFFITLRYGSNAGTPTAPLGGAPGSGSGRIEGSVYLDGNANGLRDGNESGAANVLVMLDGKFSVRTNASGNFEFPNVVSGRHTLSVLPDDLPLPWSVDSEQSISTTVTTRGTTHIDIGARRIR